MVGEHSANECLGGVWEESDKKYHDRNDDGDNDDNIKKNNLALVRIGVITFRVHPPEVYLAGAVYISCGWVSPNFPFIFLLVPVRSRDFLWTDHLIIVWMLFISFYRRHGNVISNHTVADRPAVNQAHTTSNGNHGHKINQNMITKQIDRSGHTFFGHFIPRGHPPSGGVQNRANLKRVVQEGAMWSGRRIKISSNASIMAIEFRCNGYSPHLLHVHNCKAWEITRENNWSNPSLTQSIDSQRISDV